MIRSVMENVRKARLNEACIPLVALRHVWYRIHGKNIFAHQNTRIKGLSRIDVNGTLIIGLNHVGFLHEHDRTLLRVNGRLVTEGKVMIGKGSRLDIGEGALVRLDDCVLTGNVTLIVSEGLTIGRGSVVSWGCEFIDSDWHEIRYEGRQPRPMREAIHLGEHVWVGSHCKILKGSVIADGSVVAANSLVAGRFEEPGVLIAGNPARIIRRGVSWK